MRFAIADNLSINGGDAGQWIASQDWSKSSLGALANWPLSLQTALGLTVSSPTPNCLFWGSDFIQFYNDAAHQQLSAAAGLLALGEPVAIGAPALWQTMGQTLKQVVETGRCCQIDSQLICLQRPGGAEAWCLSAMCSPVFDETEQVGGVLMVITETKVQAIASSVGQGAQCDQVTDDICDRIPGPTELALQQQLLRTFFYDSPIGLAIYDADFRCLQINDVLADMNGLPAADHIGRRMNEILPDLAVQLEPLFAAVLAEQKTVQSFEISGETAKRPGKTRHWQVSCFPLLDETNQPFGIGCAVVESTPLKQAETELFISHQKYQSIFEHTGVAICEKDFSQLKDLLEDLRQQGVTDLRQHFRAYPDLFEQAVAAMQARDVNQRALEVFEADSKAELLARWQQIFLPETHPMLLEEMLTVAEGRSRFTGEAEFQTLSGKRLWVLLTVTFPDRLSDYRSVLVSFVDISDRKQAELELQRSQAILNTFFAASPVGLALFDRDLRYVYVNEALATINNVPLTQHWGRSVSEVLPHVGRYFEPLITHVLETGELMMNREFAGVAQGETLERHCLVNYFPVRLPDGEIIGVGAIVADITSTKQTEAALRKSEATVRARLEELETFMETVPAALLIAHDSQCHEVTANRTAYQLMRAPIGGVATLTPADGSFPFSFKLQQAGQPLEPQQLPLQQAAASGEVVETNFEVVFDDDDITYLFGKAVPLFQSDGSIRGAIAAFLDVTDYRQVQASLAESEQRFRLASKAVTGVIYDWNLLTDEVFRSEGLESLIGIRPEEAPPTREWWAEQIHPDDIERLQPAMNASIEIGSDRYGFEYRLRHRNGQWIEVWDQGHLLRNDQGEIIRVVGYTIDISERKRAEQAIQISEDRYRTLANAVPQLMWVNDPDGKIQLFNDRWREYTNADLTLNVGLWQHVIHSDDFERVSQTRNSGIQAKSAYEVEVRLKRHDQVYRWHLSRVVPLKDAEGNVINWFGTAMDIHDQKLAMEERDRALQREREAREEAEAANRIKDEFLAVLSHELRSPLNPILGWATLLQQRQVTETTLKKAFATIERNIKLQLQLIDDLLDVSRILRGKLALSQSPVKLEAAIRGAIETVRLSAEAKSIRIVARLDSQIGPILGDEGRLQQIVWNLLSNAVKFTPAEGRIEVQLTRFANEAQIQVQDTGKGISPDFLPFVFDYFRQEDGTTTRQFGGLGLGLAIVRYLTEMHGGTVTVESAGLGLGTTFTVRLPLLQEPPPAHQESACPQHSSCQNALRGIRVLLVEDEKDTRELLSFLLEVNGAQVTAAASAAEAIAVFRTAPPDVLISDIGMPKVDGFMLMAQLRPDLAAMNPPPPTIALTAYAGEGDAERVRAAGFQRHLAKPIDADKLVQSILDLLHHSS